MKRTYVRPTMVGERFVANEYVAACGESGKVYKFECNAPGGKLMENTRDTVGLSNWVIIIRVVQGMKQMLRMVFMMDL